MKFPSRGLYAITQPENKTIDRVVVEVEAALKGGAHGPDQGLSMSSGAISVGQ